MKALLNIKESPYGLLLFTAIALLVAFAFGPMAHLDFQDKTMFGVPLERMVWVMPLLLLSLWLLYGLSGRFLYSKTITWVHVLITGFTALLMVAVLYMGIHPSQPAQGRHELIGNVLQVLSLLFILGQVAYLANVVLGLVGRLRAGQ